MHEFRGKSCTDSTNVIAEESDTACFTCALKLAMMAQRIPLYRLARLSTRTYDGSEAYHGLERANGEDIYHTRISYKILLYRFLSLFHILPPSAIPLSPGVLSARYIFKLDFRSKGCVDVTDECLALCAGGLADKVWRLLEGYSTGAFGSQVIG